MCHTVPAERSAKNRQFRCPALKSFSGARRQVPVLQQRRFLAAALAGGSSYLIFETLYSDDDPITVQNGGGGRGREVHEGPVSDNWCRNCAICCNFCASSGRHTGCSGRQRAGAGAGKGRSRCFLGIRYAARPVGELRFKPSKAPDRWDGIADATGMGAPCMQFYTPSGPNTTDLTRPMQGMFPTDTEATTDNEDRLFLNVRTSDAFAGKHLPMVWFHGGGYAYGSGGWPAYNCRNLAEKGDVVLVAVNHRLNAFGYLNLAEAFGEDFAASGNVGHLDLEPRMVDDPEANIRPIGQ